MTPPPDALAGPIYVDVDRTLLRTDWLHEAMRRFVLSHPWRAWLLLWWLLRGRAHLKARLASAVDVDPALLPLHEGLVDYLAQQARRGRPVHLASASPRELVERIAQRLGFVADVLGSEPGLNLKGEAKLAAMRRHSGGQAFAYAGDAVADRPIFRAASACIPVGPAVAWVARQETARKVEVSFPFEQSTLGAWWRMLRVHHWLKNLLLVLPALPVAAELAAARWWDLAAGWVATGLVASAMYVFNDLLDLEADRLHPEKRRRPLASGRIGLPAGVLAVAVGLAGGMGIAVLTVHPLFAATLAVYALASGLYSWWLKRHAVVDVLWLAGLYAMRVAMGAACILIVPSFWLIGYCLAVFLSLALLKRHVEVTRVQPGEDPLWGARGYVPGDAPFLMATGVAAACVGAMVFALYLHERTPVLPWPVLAALWVGWAAVLASLLRMWLLAARRTMDFDPVMFALQDRPTLVTAMLALAVLTGSSVFRGS